MRWSVFTASTPEWSPQEAVDTLASQGWDGVEWRVTDQTAANPPQFWSGNRATWPLATLEADLPRIAALTRGAGLAFSGLGGYAKCFERDDVERLLAATATLGARQVRVTMPAVRSGSYPDLFRDTQRDLDWVVARAEAHGVKALIELHHDTIVASASAAMRLVAGRDPAHIGVIHDLGNLVIEGFEDVLGAFQLLGPYLAHVHVKNARWVPVGADAAASPINGVDAVAWQHEWAPLPAGQGNVSAYFRALAEVGYDDWVTVEDFSLELPLLERTAANLAYVRAVWESVRS